jgi:hypothetical protein
MSNLSDDYVLWARKMALIKLTAFSVVIILTLICTILLSEEKSRLNNVRTLFNQMTNFITPLASRGNSSFV